MNDVGTLNSWQNNFVSPNVSNMNSVRSKSPSLKWKICNNQIKNLKIKKIEFEASNQVLLF